MAAAAGVASSAISSPAELLMIQQQRSGDSLAGAAQRVWSTYGLKGMYRGIVRAPSATAPNPTSAPAAAAVAGVQYLSLV